MGVAYYLSTETKIDGLDIDDFGGKCLAKADDHFEKNVYGRLGIQPLLEFMGDDPRDLWDGDAFDDMEIDPAMLAERWFAPEAGLQTITALMAYLQANPGIVAGQADVLEELQQIERMLLVCQAHGIRWHLSMDI